MMSPNEQEFLERFGPAKHTATAALIDDLLAMSSRVPEHLCHCDGAEDGRGLCRVHAAVDRIVERAHATGKRGRAWAAVERFIARIQRLKGTK